MNTITKHFISALLVLASASVAMQIQAEERAPRQQKINKLLYMYQFYYLPFSVEFREGRTINDILPMMPGKYADSARLLTAEELQALDRDWNSIKEPWKGKSLLQSTPVPLSGEVRISQHIVSHRIPLSRTAFDTLSLSDRIQLSEIIKTKSPEVQAAFKQLRFLKSFLSPAEEDKFNFFIVSASWCESCREYRVLLEGYFKEFPNADLSLHSVVIEDPKEQVFESKILKELFPNPSKYTHDSIPRFLAIETVNGKSYVYEEGEALLELYERYFKPHRGYLDGKTSLFRGRGVASKPGAPNLLDPKLTSTAQ